MKIKVKLKPNSKKESVIQESDGTFSVKVNAPPVENKANERAIELLAKHFKKPKSSITLISGHKSKNKVFHIEE